VVEFCCLLLLLVVLLIVLWVTSIVGCTVDWHSVAELFDAVHIVRLIVDGQKPTRPSDAVLIVGPLTGWPEIGQTVRSLFVAWPIGQRLLRRILSC